ncbi:hypothetical protein GCM10022287_22540 [Gryllotalpicola koreensis]|uniref:Uncharacterized protein n=1 Tax=Gryllotalpicola koreensis TaxID=993086 RepID=A0ABP8A2E1_9MICO
MVTAYSRGFEDGYDGRPLSLDIPETDRDEYLRGWQSGKWQVRRDS